MSEDNSPLSAAFERLKKSYLQAEQLMINADNASELRDHIPKVDADYKAAMDLCESLADDTVLPESSSRKTDYRREKEEFEERVKQWFKRLDGSPPMPMRSFTRAPSAISSLSTSSSVRSERRRSRVKVKMCRLAKEQEEAKLAEVRRLARREAEEKAERARREAESARREAERDAEEKAERARRDARRLEEDAEKSFRDKLHALEMAETEAVAWEEESTYGTPACSATPLHLTANEAAPAVTPKPYVTPRESGGFPPVAAKEDVQKFGCKTKDVPQMSPPFGSNRFSDSRNHSSPVNYTPKPNICSGPRREYRSISPMPCSYANFPDVEDRTLPRPVITKFDGDPMNYMTFVRQFDVYIARKTRSDEMRLLFLLQHCQDNVCEKIDRFTSKDPAEGYRLAWQTLYNEFGQPHVIAHCCEQHLKQATVVKEHDPNGLRRLSVLLDKCCTSLQDIKYASSVDTMEVMVTVAKKLPESIQERWVERARLIEGRSGRRANFVALAEFVAEESECANSIFGKALFPPPSDRHFTNRRTKVAVHNTVASTPPRKESTTAQDQQPISCPCCSGSHKLESCDEFKKKSYHDRRSIIRMKELCYRCLRKGHVIRDCKMKAACDVDGCRSTSHHSLLHNSNPPRKPDESACSTVQPQDCDVRASRVYLNVVPVIARHGDKEVATYAFLDPGSTATFCERRLMDRLQAVGTPRHVVIRTLTSPRAFDTVSISLSVRSLDGGDRIDLRDVVVTDRIPVRPNPVPDLKSIEKESHLQSLNMKGIAGGTVTLLIGANVPEALRVETTRSGNGHGPDAVRTPLGWSLLGPATNSVMYGNACSNIRPNEEVVEYAHAMFLRDESDLMPEEVFDQEETVLGQSFSTEDRKTYTLMKDSLEFVDGHYQLPLPWRHDYQVLPDNLKMARKRLDCLQRRLLRDDEVRCRYSEQMQVSIDKGFAEEVPETEMDSNRRIWYIPHHGVLNPKKPGKLRVVFDCAAQHRGISLNQVLMQGPDLVNNLNGVLLRFRKEPIALVADIEAMFYQVSVAPRDRDCLRFLWWPGGDLTKKPTPHRMKVHLFGATSSPSCAAFCLRQAASDFGGGFEPIVASTVERNFYVDDCLASVPNVEAGLRLVAGLRSLLAKAGFRLTKWLSNNKAILDSLPKEELAKSLQIPMSSEDLQERVLGIQWNVNSDEFRFSVTLPMKPCTRRGMLSTMNSLFDPLGFVAPIVVEARSIYRVLCQQELEWDEMMPKKERLRWERWLSNLSKLRDVSVPRSLSFSSCDDMQKCQLHYFADASKIAYGAVCYLRSVNRDNIVQVTLVTAKSRLSPSGEVSIPRLELIAAVMAVRLDQMVKGELNLELRPSVFWTDSSVVLQSIQNDRRRFPLFVARRLAMIERLTNTSNWKHVPTKQNPADLVSRGVSADKLVQSDVWFVGPTFLREDPGCWPNMFEKRPLKPEDVKVFDSRPAEVFLGVECSATDRLLSYYSCLYKLNVATAWILRFGHYLQDRKEVSKLPITVEELKGAESAWVRYMQQQHFAQWMLGIGEQDRSVKVLKKSSPVFKLDPIYADGILRVGGRLKQAPLKYEAKHPAILPHVSHLTDLIIQHHHVSVGHSGVNHTLNAIFQRYWIVKAAVAVRRVISKCVSCRHRHARPGQQIMSDLPPPRLQVNSPPFTYVGVDYFGPLMVRQRRSEVKRYGCLFTCMTTRAVHLEVAYDLSTDALINALRRFIARRGRVTHIYSDNGTNLVGAERILREAIQGWNESQIHNYLRQKEIQWSFNPPSASHMGGVWERMIRSIRSVLAALTNERILTDDQLQTFLLEAEAIVNSRPLTPVTLDVDDGTPLTPNHLLAVNQSGNLPPAVTSDRDCFARRGWRHVQYLSDQFWKRFSREYLRTIITRQKWHRQKENFRVDDIVLVVDNTSPRSQWSLGRVLKLFPDQHDIVRSVLVRMKGTEVRRPIHKLCLIQPAEMEHHAAGNPVEEEDSNTRTV